MASVGFHCVGKNNPLIQNHTTHFLIDRSNKISLSNPSLSISKSNHPIKKNPQPISANLTTSKSNPPISSSPTCTITPNPILKIFEKNRQNERNQVIFSQKLDEWVRDSVVEIVQNLNQSPLLVQVYAENNGSMKTKTEKTSFDQWKNVNREWEVRETPSPDGIIYVERIEGKRVMKEGVEEEETRVWGVVVQGKWVECGPVCYLLKTSRVGVGGELGLFCTHFLLVRVESFRESALSQIRDCWLLQY